MSTNSRSAQVGNILLESCINLLFLLLPVKAEDKGASLGADFRERILNGFGEFERAASGAGVESEAIGEARYALAAFADEAVLSSAWPYKDQWSGQPLQLQFFGEHLAGEGFFKKLSQLRQAGERKADVLEVYYICLQLGFEGVYKVRGTEALRSLQVDLRAQINDYRGDSASELSVHGKPKNAILDRVERNVPYWVVGAATIAILFFGYVGFDVAVGEQARVAYRQVERSWEHIAAYTPKASVGTTRAITADRARQKGRDGS